MVNQIFLRTRRKTKALFSRIPHVVFKSTTAACSVTKKIINRKEIEMELWSLSCLESSGNEDFVKETFIEPIPETFIEPIPKTFIEPIPETFIEPKSKNISIKVHTTKRQSKITFILQQNSNLYKLSTNIRRNIYCHPDLIRDGVSTVTSP